MTASATDWVASRRATRADRRRREAMTWAGYRQARYARSSGTLVAVLHNEEAGLDAEAGPYSTLCDDHGTCVAHETLGLARSHAAAPEGWCEECMEVVG